MKRMVAALLLLTGLAGLTGCAPLFNSARADHAGLYQCVSLDVQDLELTPEEKWIRLNADGSAVVCLAGAEEPASWSIQDSTVTLTIEGEPSASGTLTDGALEITLREIQGVYVLEGMAIPEKPDEPNPEREAPETENPAEDVPEDGTETKDGASDPKFARYSCYNGLYSVEYPADRFQPGPQGKPDLWAEDGTQIWFSRLGSQELVQTWLDSFAEKGAGQKYLSYEGHDWTVQGVPAQAIVYQAESLWHMEALISFPENRGGETLPLYAVYVVAEGPDRSSVWNDEMKEMLNSLRLGDQV